MRNIMILFVLLASFSFLFSQTAPIVYNVTASQRTDGSKIVDIYYDVLDPEGDMMLVSLQVSDDFGATWDIIPADSLLSGDIGGVLSGAGKHIIWEAGEEETIAFEGSSYRFKVIANDDTVTDIDGNVYPTVEIGGQTWMAVNLKVTHYRNGDPIPNVTDNSEWSGLSTGAYCVYDNNPANAETYGNLYNWYAVDDPRGLAPEGWHIATDNEIKELEMHLGMSESEANSTGYRGTNEGSKLGGNAALWNDGELENDIDFEVSGFSLLPSGSCSGDNGDFAYLGVFGTIWSSSEFSSTHSWRRRLYYDYTTVTRNNDDKRDGFSIRCVKGPAPVTDIDGNEYKTIQIGNQIWMAENLKVTHYRNSDPMPNVTGNSEWVGLSTGAYCYYANNSANNETYGALYNWFAVDDPRGLAPEGWRVPTDEDFKQLEMFLGMSESEANSTDWRGTNEGSKLAGRADLWNDGILENDSEFNTSGFSLFPAGGRYYPNGVFNHLGIQGDLWSSTENNGTDAFSRVLHHNYTSIYRSYGTKNYGFSIRCVKVVE